MSGEDFGEEEYPILPLNTKVVVAGNNRTKSDLIGLHGIVKKAVSKGGWHWLALANGDEVKLQRNALSVVEVPTGNEEDDDEVEDFSSSVSDLPEYSSANRDEVKFQRNALSVVEVPTGNEEDDNEALANGDEVKLQRNALNVIKVPAGNEEDDDKEEDISSSGSDLGSSCSPQIKQTANLRKLETATLKRYCEHFKLDELNYHTYSREQLVETVEKHFKSQEVDELQVIADVKAKALKQSGHTVPSSLEEWRTLTLTANTNKQDVLDELQVIADVKAKSLKQSGHTVSSSLEK